MLPFQSPCRFTSVNACHAGSRSQLYSYLYSTLILSMSCGPLISAIVFWVTGNSWDVTSLERVILIGMAAALVSQCIVSLP